MFRSGLYTDKPQHGSMMVIVDCFVTKSSPINKDKGGDEESHSRRHIFATTSRTLIRPDLYSRECLHSWHMQSRMKENAFNPSAAVSRPYKTETTHLTAREVGLLVVLHDEFLDGMLR